MKWLLYLAFIVSLITWSFWTYIKDYTGVQIFYVGVAIFILLLTLYMYILEKGSFIKFLLFELSVANLIKELFLDPGKLTLEEAMLIVYLPFIWYITMKNKTW